jgi:molybdopterin synthase sulfur carrier subunit
MWAVAELAALSHNPPMPAPDVVMQSADRAPVAPAGPSVCVEFAASLRRHVDCAPQHVAPAALRAVLESALAAAPGLAGYVFDDQRHVRKHVAVFVNQRMLQDRQRLDQVLAAGDRVLVVQALSGG